MGTTDPTHRTVWREATTVKMIDQTKLPHTLDIMSLPRYQDTARAIKEMNVRGAPAIGATAAYALAQAVAEAPPQDFLTFVTNARAHIEQTRPTAVDLFHATARVFDALPEDDHEAAKAAAFNEAEKIAQESVDMCKAIGTYGATLIQDKARIATHCNAGSLATVSLGTALSPIFHAHREGKEIFVYVDETRPRAQGARLTAWELLTAGVPHTIISDNVTGFLMQRGKIDLMIVGADRIVAADGSVANKIGTYEKAVCAKENGVPFYVAAPTSTVDFSLNSGSDIPIEERSQDEVLYIRGKNDQGELARVRIAPEGSTALNLAFDVTPAKYVTGIITEKGIVPPTELHRLK